MILYGIHPQAHLVLGLGLNMSINILKPKLNTMTGSLDVSSAC